MALALGALASCAAAKARRAGRAAGQSVKSVEFAQEREALREEAEPEGRGVQVLGVKRGREVRRVPGAAEPPAA